MADGGSVRVSVGLPVFNGERFLGEALDSILSQTWPDFELIVSDNGSTDRTAAICEAYAASDARIRYVRQEVNRGASFNFAHVFRLARGEYFKWAAADDLIEPTFLERCVEALDTDPGAVLALPRARIIDERGRTVSFYDDGLRTDSSLPHVRFADLLLVPHKAHQAFSLVRRAVLARTALLAPFTSSDKLLIAEIALYGRFHRVPEPLFVNREHAGQSFRVHPDKESRMAWFTPEAAGKLVYPWWRFYFEGLKTIRRAELGWRERALCLAALDRWAAQNSRYLRRELKRKALQLAGALPASGRAVRF